MKASRSRHHTRYLRQAIALAAFAGSAASAQPADPLAAASDRWGFIEQYCTKCHNYEDFAGGLTLEGMDPDSVAVLAMRACGWDIKPPTEPGNA